jgi:uncharacterized membrane protein YeaQ/YmgE (transglycosylase-associated protein family)
MNISIDLGQLIVWLITGALAGYLAGVLLRGRGFGVLGNLIIGLLGGLLGGIVFGLLGISLNLPRFTFSLADLIVAFIGALILLFLMSLVRNRTR